MKIIVKSFILIFALFLIKNECEAVHFKDSTSGLFLRAGYKNSFGINFDSHNDSVSMGYSSERKAPFGFKLGLRYSSTFKKIKNNRLSYWGLIDFQFEQFEELLIFDTFPDENYIVRNGNTGTSKGISFEDVTFKQLPILLNGGIKYNLHKFRVALGYWLGTNLYSKSLNSTAISSKSGFLQENSRNSIISKVHHGITFDVLIPATRKFGFVFGASGSFKVKTNMNPGKFSNIGAHAHVGIDYKISK